MKVKVDRVITNLLGMPIKDDSGNDLTLRVACVNALLTGDPAKDDGETKNRNFHIAEKIMKGGKEVDLSAEEIVLIKEYIGKIYNTMVVGRTWDMLEGKDVATE